MNIFLRYCCLPLASIIIGVLFFLPTMSRATEAQEIEQIPLPVYPDESSEPAPPAPFNQPTAPPQPFDTQGAPRAVSSMPATPGGARSTPNTPTLRPGEMLFNFQEADITAVVKTVAQITGRNFLIDPRIKGRMTIISAKPVPKSAVYQIFLAALKAQGYTATQGPSGILKIVLVSEAKQSAGVSTSDTPRGGEETVTHIVTVQHGSATQMIPLLRPLMAPTSQLSVYPPTNALIITDFADNVRNLLRIIEILDRAGAADIAIIQLKHASALDMAEAITRLYPNIAQSGVPGGQPGIPGMSGGEAIYILPDLRTNSLLVRTDNQGLIKQLRDTIEKLDVPARVEGNTRVVYLRNGDAVKMAEILRGLLAGERTAQTAAAVPGRPAISGKGSEPSLVQADETTNSLIISASDAVFNNLRAVIEKLDIRRAQVYVEALIAEITTEKASQFGFQWAAGNKAGSGAIAGISNFPTSGSSIIGTAVDPRGLANAGGLSLAYIGEKITLSDGTVIRGLGALARALEGNSSANILSTPNLLTLDNAEAKIVVGKNVPFLTGSFSQATGTSGTVNPFQTIERKDVGITLKIKPQISEGGSVKLAIFQEVSSVAPTAGVDSKDLITNKRSLETTVVVDDGNTVVLGGLIEDNANDSTQAVPFLGRIPLLGWMFKYRDQKKTKTNLMVFLRPIIVRSPQDSYGFSANRYEYMQGVKKAASKDKTPILDDFKPMVPKPETKPQKSESVDAPNTADKDRLLGPPSTPEVAPEPSPAIQP